VGLKILDELGEFVYILTTCYRKELQGNLENTAKHFWGPRSQNMQEDFEFLHYFTLFYFLPLTHITLSFIFLFKNVLIHQGLVTKPKT